jgi:hypothetical protein
VERELGRSAEVVVSRAFSGGAMRYLRHAALVAVLLGTSSVHAQRANPLPVIDMHFHGAFVFGEQSVQPIQPWLQAFDSHNVKYSVLMATHTSWQRGSPRLPTASSLP